MNRRFRSKSAGLNEVVSALQRNGHWTFLTATKEWTLRRSRMTGTADMDSTILASLASAIGILFWRVSLFDRRRITEWRLSVTSVINGSNGSNGIQIALGAADEEVDENPLYRDLNFFRRARKK